MGSKGVGHLLRHIQHHMSPSPQMAPCGEHDRKEEAVEKVLFGRIVGHVFIFLDGEIRRTGKNEIVVEGLEVDGFRGLENHGEWSGGIQSMKLTVGGGKVGVGIDARVRDTQRERSEGSTSPACGRIEDAMRRRVVFINPFGYEGLELIHGAIIELEHIVLGSEELVFGRVGGKSLLFVLVDELGQPFAEGGILVRLEEREMSARFRLQAVMKE